jgi:hypothetical protein
LARKHHDETGNEQRTTRFSLKVESVGKMMRVIEEMHDKQKPDKKTTGYVRRNCKL